MTEELIWSLSWSQSLHTLGMFQARESRGGILSVSEENVKWHQNWVTRGPIDSMAE